MQKSKTTVKENIFMSAKKAAPAKEAKSKVISLTISPELEQHVKAYVEAKSQCKNWEAKLSIEEGFIKEKARDLYLKEYRKQGRNIGSFKLADVTVSVQDRYTKMTDDVAAIVAKNFPDVIERNTEYAFNQEILRKYIEEISDALQSAEGIPEDDLAALIEAKDTVNVKKGTIDTLAQYGDQINDLFYAIAPIVSMR
ncbi:hypothetical protein [Chitinophaga cymbidii]|uniref:Uncharacterized protein n=1 Tax=Chitinophaga cymbidii TaxID=1096750 RepID=A0A512RPQ8_9BACT|nr:hypothetical protein [Chitinophaga cymbidii]GEP97680.1 hypothetical protein CCY01nite_39400 [Chitinophaga cymbidii]